MLCKTYRCSCLWCTMRCPESVIQRRLLWKYGLELCTTYSNSTMTTYMNLNMKYNNLYMKHTVRQHAQQWKNFDHSWQKYCKHSTFHWLIASPLVTVLLPSLLLMCGTPYHLTSLHQCYCLSSSNEWSNDDAAQMYTRLWYLNIFWYDILVNFFF